jgi:hypothetical protein
VLAQPSGTVEVPPSDIAKSAASNAGSNFSPTSSSTPVTVICDPFVTITTSSDAAHRYVYLWLEDTQPQISGARYKYILVRFKPNHEIDQLIPTTEVDVP